MSEVEPDVNRLLERTLRRSRALRTRRRVFAAGGGLCLVVGLMVALAFARVWGGSSAGGGSDVRVGGAAACTASASGSSACVTLPPVDASAETVVLTYLAALDRHDIALAKQLLEPGYRKQVESEADGDFENVVSISDVRITGTSTDYGPWRKPLPNGYSDVITVQTRYNLHQKRVESRNDGDTMWGYTLVRRGPGSRWLIEEEGMG